MLCEGGNGKDEKGGGEKRAEFHEPDFRGFQVRVARGYFCEVK
jgi:hypothetical protein